MEIVLKICSADLKITCFAPNTRRTFINQRSTYVSVQKTIPFFFLYIFSGFLCIGTSAAPQRPAHGTVSSQVATLLRTDRVCRVLGRSWIRTQDYWFAVRCATIEPPLLLPLSHLSSYHWATSPRIPYHTTPSQYSFLLLAIHYYLLNR
jgi:hypothetical protein